MGAAPSAGDLRGEIGRHRVPKYRLASAAGMHPARLSAFLNEKLPLRPEMARRIEEALLALAAERQVE